jgi:transcriptional regulator with XRE-family HTH domain
MFNQFEIEDSFYRNLERGDEREIAERLGCSQSYISQLYNPHDPRESTLFRAIKEIAALIEVDTTRGLRELDLFNAYVKRAVPADYEASVREERRRLMKEVSEWELSEMDDSDDLERLSELEDVHRQSGILAAALRNKIYPVRSAMAAAVTNKNGREKP